MKIRLAHKDDIEAIANIEKTCFPDAEAASQKDFEERFQVFANCFFVAEEDQHIIGFINGCLTNQMILEDILYHNPLLHNPQGDYQTVFGLDVLPSYQKQGIGEQLLNTMIETAYQRGQKGVILTCKDYLVHYYEKFGFVKQGISASQHGGAKWNDMILIFERNQK